MIDAIDVDAARVYTIPLRTRFGALRAPITAPRLLAVSPWANSRACWAGRASFMIDDSGTFGAEAQPMSPFWRSRARRTDL